MKQQIRHIVTCEICDNKNLIPVLDLGDHPMCDDLIPIGDKRICKEYPIKVVFCEKCKTAHQLYQVPKKELFSDSYHYRSRFTADVLNGMKQLVITCEKKLGDLNNKKVLDIGCNDGSLLDFFKQKGSVTFGIEPTNAYRDAEVKGHNVYHDFLSVRIAKKIVSVYGKPDLITFTNVFAHIENFKEVLLALKVLMAPSTIIVIENHYLGSVLDGHQFDTFYHEHPRSYSYTSFEYIAGSLGVKVSGLEFPSRYGGNIRVFLGNTPAISYLPAVEINKLKERESRFVDVFLSLQSKIDYWCKVKNKFINDYVKNNGRLCAKAFPGRAAIIVKLLGLNEKLISAVYEKPGSLKIGHYVPGTRIPIYSDEKLFAKMNDSQLLLNFAWHIPKEIRNYMLDNNFRGTIVDILNSEDFMVREVEAG